MTTDNTPLISFRGKTHTLYEWSRLRDIHFSLMYHRMQSGCCIEKVLGLDMKPWEKKERRARRQASRKANKVNRRINPRWMEMMIFAEVKKPCAHWAELLGISAAKLFHRVKKFGNGEEGLENAIVSLFRDGTISLMRIVSALGVSYAAVYRRYKTMGSDPQLLPKALKPHNEKVRLLSYRGEEVPVAEMAKRMGIPHRTLNQRIKRWGCSQEAMKFLLYPGRLTSRLIEDTKLNNSPADEDNVQPSSCGEALYAAADPNP